MVSVLVVEDDDKIARSIARYLELEGFSVERVARLQARASAAPARAYRGAAVFGMLALSGIVVNDSLILVTRYNDDMRAGADDPIVSAAASRFRAVFLTTVTTVAVLIPILLQTSEQAQYLTPAAVSLVFGELFATIITLVLVPVPIAICHAPRKRTRATRAPQRVRGTSA